MIITEKQRAFLNTIIDNLDELISEDNLTELLWLIDDLIIEKGMTADQELLTPYGIELQKIYDDIYYQNEE